MKATGLTLFVGFCLLYFFTAAGYVDTIDATPSIQAAEALLTTHKLSFPLKDPWFAVHAASRTPGEYASKMGLVPSLLYYLPVRFAAFFSPENRFRVTEALVSLVNGPLTALTILLLLHILIRRNFSISSAFTISVIAGVTTLLWPYSKTCHRESLQALALVGMLWATLEKRPIAVGLFFAMGLLTKLAWFVPATPLVLFALHSFAGHRRKMIMLISVLGFGVALYGAYAWYLFGSPFSTGYSADTVSPTGRFWSTPLLQGLFAQTISLSTGLFAFSPVLLVCLCLFTSSKGKDLLTWTCLSAITLQTVFYSRWQDPLGGQTLGPRYLVVIIPIFFLLFDGKSLGIFRLRPAKALALALTGWSLALQIAFVSVKPQQIHALQEKSPLWLTHLQLFTHKLSGAPEIYETVDLSNHRSFQGFNFWWAHALRTRTTILSKNNAGNR